MNTKERISGICAAGYLIGAMQIAIIGNEMSKMMRIFVKRHWRRVCQEEDPSKVELLSTSLDEVKRVFGFGEKLVLRLQHATIRRFVRIEGKTVEPQLRHLIYLSESNILEIPGMGKKRKKLLVKGLIRLGVPEQMIRFK